MHELKRRLPRRSDHETGPAKTLYLHIRSVEGLMGLACLSVGAEAMATVATLWANGWLSRH